FLLIGCGDIVVLCPIMPNIVQFKFEGGGGIGDSLPDDLPWRTDRDRTQHPRGRAKAIACATASRRDGNTLFYNLSVEILEIGKQLLMTRCTVSEVIASNIPQFAKGDIVVGRTG